MNIGFEISLKTTSRVESAKEENFSVFSVTEKLIPKWQIVLQLEKVEKCAVYTFFWSGEVILNLSCKFVFFLKSRPVYGVGGWVRLRVKWSITWIFNFKVLEAKTKWLSKLWEALGWRGPYIPWKYIKYIPQIAIGDSHTCAFQALKQTFAKIESILC